MKELDFDELDRAVNSLMSNVPDKPKDEHVPQEKTLELSGDQAAPAPVLPVAVTPDKKAGVDAKVPDTDEATKSDTGLNGASKAPAARRGRFMDVVPRQTTIKPQPARISREGRSFAPTSPMTQEPLEQSKPVVSPTASQPQQAKEPVASIELPSAPKNDWPDPLEMMPSEDTKTTEKEQSPQEDEAMPMSSPFLADAKVEKRPLGQPEVSTPFTPHEEEQGTTISGTAAGVVQPPAHTEEAAKAPEPPSALPEELDSDLMAIESGAHEEAETESQPKVPSLEDAPKETKISPLEPSVPSAPKESTMPQPGSTSIPQQYKEAPSTGDKTSGAIYDTENYHKPLAHPEKKKSGWMWVVWIIVILILGAGGGAAVYFLKLF